MKILSLFKKNLKKILNNKQEQQKEIEKQNEKFFNAHEEFISNKFGLISENFAESKLDDSLLEQIIDHINNENCYELEDLLFESKRVDKIMQVSRHSPKVVKKLSKLLTNCINLNPANNSIRKLHEFIRNEFKNYFKSPITFVNSRAWLTPPKSNNFGPNSPHTDGFSNGHLKVMIYPYGLSKENGELLLENKLLTNKPKGYAIAFKNSDVMHAGSAGEVNNRLSIEITVMRSIIPMPQINKSHFFGRHYKSPFLIYNGANISNDDFLENDYMSSIYNSFY